MAYFTQQLLSQLSDRKINTYKLPIALMTNCYCMNFDSHVLLLLIIIIFVSVCSCLLSHSALSERGTVRVERMMPPSGPGAGPGPMGPPSPPERSRSRGPMNPPPHQRSRETRMLFVVLSLCCLQGFGSRQNPEINVMKLAFPSMIVAMWTVNHQLS